MLNLGSLQSALARPYDGYHRTTASKAAALMQSVATNHAFVDGNKRTAVILVDLLIERSGWRLQPLPGEDPNRLIEDFVADGVVGGRWPVKHIEEWFQDRMRRQEPA
jgi:death-on-curing protein